MKKWIPIIVMTALAITLAVATWVLCRGLDEWEVSLGYTTQFTGQSSSLILLFGCAAFVLSLVLGIVAFGIMSLAKKKTTYLASTQYTVLFRRRVLAFPIGIANLYYIWVVWHVVPDYIEHCM